MFCCRLRFSHFFECHIESLVVQESSVVGNSAIRISTAKISLVDSIVGPIIDEVLLAEISCRPITQIHSIEKANEDTLFQDQSMETFCIEHRFSKTGLPKRQLGPQLAQFSIFERGGYLKFHLVDSTNMSASVLCERNTKTLVQLLELAEEMKCLSRDQARRHIDNHSNYFGVIEHRRSTSIFKCLGNLRISVEEFYSSEGNSQEGRAQRTFQFTAVRWSDRFAVVISHEDLVELNRTIWRSIERLSFFV